MRHYCAVCASSIEGALEPRLVAYAYLTAAHEYVCSESCERVYDQRLAEERNRAILIRDFQATNADAQSQP